MPTVRDPQDPEAAPTVSGGVVPHSWSHEVLDSDAPVPVHLPPGSEP